jgi:hypothetical protein
VLTQRRRYIVPPNSPYNTTHITTYIFSLPPHIVTIFLGNPVQLLSPPMFSLTKHSSRCLGQDGLSTFHEDWKHSQKKKNPSQAVTVSPRVGVTQLSSNIAHERFQKQVSPEAHSANIFHVFMAHIPVTLKGACVAGISMTMRVELRTHRCTNTAATSLFMCV